MYEQIKNMIIKKKNDIDSQTLYYFTNYFYVLVERDLIPSKLKLEDLIDNALYYAQEVVFYDENSDVYRKLGPDVKGLCDPETKILYVRNNLPEPLREMVIYHELHHATQTNRKNGQVGINQNFNIGRMIMEAQTQWFAEEVYKTIHNVEFDEREIPSEQLRMLSGGRIVSALHNYEMYDAMLSKLAIILDVSKDFFVSINFLYNKDEGLKLLKEKYNEKAKELKIEKPFSELLYMLDYIYVVDYCLYINNEDKEVILSGKETDGKYWIYPGRAEKLSLLNERKNIDEFDIILALALIENGFEHEEFFKYIVDTGNRKRIVDYVSENKKGK